MTIPDYGKCENIQNYITNKSRVLPFRSYINKS